MLSAALEVWPLQTSSLCDVHVRCTISIPCLKGPKIDFVVSWNNGILKIFHVDCPSQKTSLPAAWVSS